MSMDPREFELIAMSHVLARYRVTGVLPNINGEPFDLAKFKERLFAGVEADTDVDVAIIKNTIVNEDDCEHGKTEPAVTAEPKQPSPEPAENAGQEEPKQEPTEQKEEPAQENPNPIFGGKLFQFFNKDSR